MKRFKSFKMSETTCNQIASLPDKMQLAFYRAVCDYGINGVEPNFSGVENSIWIPMKDLIDYSNDRSRTNSENGKKGGAPIGNNNRSKATSSKVNQNQPNVADVVMEAGRYDYYIDAGTAQDFLECGIDEDWFVGPHSFIEFVAERINEKYDDKPTGDRKAIFISAVKTWDDLRYEYPQWKAKKDRRDADDAYKAAQEKAWMNHPKKCIHCDGELKENGGNFHCFTCNYICELNKDTLEWEWRKW